MFEGIILIIFFIIGGLTALLALFFFVLAIFRKSKRLFKIGLGVAVVPFSLYALTCWFYDIHIPRLNKKVEKEYAGTYVMVWPSSSENSGSDNRQPHLVLKTDNTFQLDKNNYIRFYGQGTWRAGATEDGHFEFKDKNNSIVFWAEPTGGNKLGVDIEGLNTQRVEFAK
ncbi:hypothetical protein KJS94_02865 [Flavihumibacter rivuli]|uniref:hypothetical protein n=1 Tax=Flavihumibacter rivuli TaxID=2838156 RepID=UPI001BDF673B|nr:hypothetical protein [Flavihumibacter rivuli]ULQ57138.1 hypothetical protein KJS94_02865 [Flavihumibacter rivuli]